MFWNKPIKEEKILIESAEYRKLVVRLTQIEADILGLATAQDVIRNKVMKKIRLTQKDSEETEENDNTWNGIPLWAYLITPF